MVVCIWIIVESSPIPMQPVIFGWVRIYRLGSSVASGGLHKNIYFFFYLDSLNQ